MLYLLHHFLHFKFPTVRSVDLNETLVVAVRVAASNIEKRKDNYGAPIVLLAYSSKVVLCLLTVALVDEVEGLGVSSILRRALHRRSDHLPSPVAVFLPVQHTLSFLQDDRRVEV